MLERLEGYPEGTLAIRATGKVTRADYMRLVEPAFERARREGRRLRLLFHLPPEFAGFSAGGAVADTWTTLRHRRACEAAAIVSDRPWIRASARVATLALPYPVRVFRDAQLEEAIAWLNAGAAAEGVSSHRLLPEGVLVVEVSGPLHARDFEALAQAADPWIAEHGQLRGLVIHTREFPGWQDVAGLLRHLRFAREHRRAVARIALAAGGRVASYAPRLAARFTPAEVKRFGWDELEEAIAWAKEGAPGEAKRAA